MVRFLNSLFKSRYLLILSFCALSCDDFYETPEVTYVINKGDHRSRVYGSLPGSRLRSLKSDGLKLSVRFDSSAIYNLGDADQADVNKLFGFSDCNSSHQDNSARFGWAWNIVENKIDIYAYVYKDSQRIIKEIQAIDIGKNYILELRLVQDNYEFIINGESITRVQRGNTCERGLYYLLYPYFGGNRTAPHDIRIHIEELFE